MNEPKDAVYWYEQFSPQVKKLDRDIEVDVVVVGGGAAGLSAAQVLHNAGKQVVVVEAEFCGGGASGKSSGFITPDSELEFSDLVGMFGEEDALKLWQFAVAGLEQMRGNISEYHIACDYVEEDSLFIAKNKKGVSLVADEYEAQAKAGFEVWLYERERLSQIIGSKQYYAGVRTKGTFGINALSYCQGLKQSLEAKGVLVYEHTKVQRISASEVACESGTIKSNSVVVCTDRFLPDLGIARPKVYHAQTFVGLTRPISDADVQRLFPDGPLMVWDTDLIYQYFRLTGDNRLLIGSADLAYTYWPGEIHESKRITHKLYKYLQRYFPDFSFTIEYQWPGLIGVTKDFAPIAGQSKLGAQVFFAGAGAGLPWATSLGRYAAEKCLSGRDDLDSFLHPDRKFPIPDSVQAITGKPLGFALSHGLSKYKKYL